MKTIRQTANSAPRASQARPQIRENQDGTVIIKTGSPADACRMIDALRQAGYFARLADPRDGRTIMAAPLSWMI